MVVKRFLIRQLQFSARFAPRFAATLSLALGLLPLCSLSAFAAEKSIGEKIEFSDAETQVELPAPGLNLDRFTHPDSPFRRDHTGGNLAAPAPRSNIQSKKLEELLDRQKSWLAPDATEADREAVLKRIFSIRDYDLDRRNSKNPQSFELFEQDSQKKSSGKSDRFDRSRPGFDDSKDNFDNSSALGSTRNEKSWGLNEDSTSFGSDKRGMDAGDVINEIDVGALLQANRPSNDFSRMRDQLMGRPTAQSPFEEIERVSSRAKFSFENTTEHPLPSVQDWMQPNRTALSSLQQTLGLRDPIHFERDSTQTPLQPFRANGFMEDSEQDRSDFSPRFTSQIGGIPRTPSNPLDALKARELSPSSLSPAITLPDTSRPLVQPKPAVLPLPTRKF